MSRSSWTVNSSWSGFTMLTALCASMSRAYTGPALSCLMCRTASSTSRASASVSCFTRCMNSCTSSTTPAVVWCSWTPPSRRNAQRAAPRGDRPHAVRRDGQRTAVHLDVAVPDQLARLPARHGEAHPVHEIVQATLQRHQQRLTGDPGLLEDVIEDVAELPLRKPVDPLDLLLLAQLALIVGRLAPASGRLTMLARRVGPPLHRALLGAAARPLVEQLCPLATAQLARGPGVACHDSDPPLLGRPTPAVGNRRHVAARADLQARGREGLDRRLAARPRALHAHGYAPHAQGQRLAGRLRRRDSGGERRGLLGALKPGLARGPPGEGIPLHVGD